MAKIRTYLTVLVELEEEVAAVDISCPNMEERYFPALERAVLSVPQCMDASLVRSQVFYPDPDMPGVLLRACPFCGGVIPVHTEECTCDPCPDGECELCEEKCYRVICDPERGGCGHGQIEWYDNRGDAADAWNERSECCG